VSTISEQNLDGRPQLYGLHNLNGQSIFLADETEHNYFTLPADYPLEQTTPPPQPSVAAQAAGWVQALLQNQQCSGLSAHLDMMFLQSRSLKKSEESIGVLHISFSLHGNASR
jgi:hypothetical protein